MDQPGQHLLAHPGFSGNQHRGIELGYPAGKIQDMDKPLVADLHGKDVRSGQGFLELGPLPGQFELLFFKPLAQPDNLALDIRGLEIRQMAADLGAPGIDVLAHGQAKRIAFYPAFLLDEIDAFPEAE